MNIENILNEIPISEGIEAHIDLVREELSSREMKLLRSTLCEAEALQMYLDQNQW